jgi:hypothetical protein
MSIHQEREVWEEIEQRYHKKMILDMDMDKEGAIKILGQRKHISRGSKLMNFD